MKTEIRLYDTVALLEDLPDEKLVRGQVGVVIEIHAPDAFEVEFSDTRSGITYAMCVLRADQLLPLRFTPSEIA